MAKASKTLSDDTSSVGDVKHEKSPIHRRHDASSDEEPLVDKTEALALHSKKTARRQRRQSKQSARKIHSDVHSFLDLPSELLFAVLSFMQPSDIFKLLRLNHSTRAFILDNEKTIASRVIAHRYWVLHQCFPAPLSLDDVPASVRPAPLSQAWQDRLRIHKNPYQHIKQIDSRTHCTCMSCVLAWNNLNIILDLAHWQSHFDNREPLPIIPRGTNPDWNIELLDHHAEIATKAMRSPLAHARILQTHLDTTTRTIVRSSRPWLRKTKVVDHNRTTAVPAAAVAPRPRLYDLTNAEARAGTDAYLERSGPASYQPIYMRDNYYNVEAFVPNRKWNKDEQRWQYYSRWPATHENDLAWLVARYMPPGAH